MIRLSRLADYAVAILCEMASHPDGTLSAKYLSERTRISESTVMKILKLLAKHKIILSSRGSKGGYSVCQIPQDTTLLSIIQAIDGPITSTVCSEHGSHPCELEANCLSRHGWKKVNSALEETLAQFNLTDFIKQKHKSPSYMNLLKEHHVA